MSQTGVNTHTHTYSPFLVLLDEFRKYNNLNFVLLITKEVVIITLHEVVYGKP